jgi:hypothetical protein
VLQVLACPRASCLAYGCPGYEFSTNGLRGCSINTSAPAGSVFRVPFVVLDPSTGTGRASVERTVVIASPCGAGLYYCGGGCVKVRCEDCCTASRCLMLVPEESLQPAAPTAPT